MHIYWIYKDDTDEFICRGAVEKQTENRPMEMGGGEEGKCEMYGESNMETYISICKIDSQGEFAVSFRKLKQGLCINLEG